MASLPPPPSKKRPTVGEEVQAWSKFPDEWDIRAIEHQTAEEMISKQRDPERARLRLALFRKQIHSFFNKQQGDPEEDGARMPIRYYEGRLPCNINLAYEPTRPEIALLNQELGVRGLTILNDRSFERQHFGTLEEEQRNVHDGPYPKNSIVVGCHAHRVGQTLSGGGGLPDRA